MMYLIEESLDAVKKKPTWMRIEDEADTERLWKLVEQKHKVHIASNVKEIIKLMARANYQIIHQVGYESIISYKKRLSFVLKSCEDQGDKKQDPPDIVMDFFHGLDNAQYNTFKTCNRIHVQGNCSTGRPERDLSLGKPVVETKGSKQWRQVVF